MNRMLDNEKHIIQATVYTDETGKGIISKYSQRF